MVCSHARRHLKQFTLEVEKMPSLLITDAFNALVRSVTPLPQHQHRRRRRRHVVAHTCPLHARSTLHPQPSAPSVTPFSRVRLPPVPPPADRPLASRAVRADYIVSTLAGGGDVLMPVDAARVLEALILLNSFWCGGPAGRRPSALTPRPRSPPARREEKDSAALLEQCQLVLLSPTASSTLDSARTYIEWFSRALEQQFNERRDNPFEHKCGRHASLRLQPPLSLAERPTDCSRQGAEVLP